MMSRFAILAALATALVGFGMWMGHASNAQPAAVVTTPVVTATLHAHAAPPLATPTLDPGLAADLRDPDPEIRRAAVRELASSDARDPATLLAASHDPDLGVAVLATTGLATLYRDGQLPAKELATRIADHGLTERVRVAALNGLGTVRSSEGATVLADLSVHGDVTERRSAAILLQHQDPITAVPSLIAALADSDEYVRMNAIESLRSFARGRDFGTDAAAWQRWWSTRST